MKYKILNKEKVINTILAEEDFVKAYCTKNGYTYQEITEQEIVFKPPTMEERIETLEAQNKALTTSNQFLEDCIVEMAGAVYA